MMLEVDWRGTYINFVKEKKLPLGVTKKSPEAIRIMRHNKGLVIVGDKLYKRGTSSGVLMKCVPNAWGRNILLEIHEGTCGNHAASKTLVGKAYRAGFWWPTAISDVEDLVRKC
ncbi:retrotransposon protein, putative, Ty3-gypsy subclass [Panicum miliaceum]|uniref:Retrotransposon protein, putative, Ty3-gypsy subclass n=1 Tax=Panicum miliaceum TaxID=4540 RepID=A0A3L6RGY4_PANMI|nr:retrotransposon protein, putative, Ty3-gypsy subclass [Panicum miliaceum]